MKIFNNHFIIIPYRTVLMGCNFDLFKRENYYFSFSTVRCYKNINIWTIRYCRGKEEKKNNLGIHKCYAGSVKWKKHWNFFVFIFPCKSYISRFCVNVGCPDQIWNYCWWIFQKRNPCVLYDLGKIFPQLILHTTNAINKIKWYFSALYLANHRTYLR